eukprot:CAMPEP_0196809688 /NCGR_PEP_ID=MMETSP1362-20130617/9592_1 /TAXON_ID=163516 /ORGANISM="Leptocylindrus danicus, Strain CCMP1856" /LENGTH=179 /DNA_ID=CAMNT_0042184447 /DNA_START=68 /DNA_END=607 /DNA_ORIENTATION=-
MNVMDKVKDGAKSAKQALGIEQKEPDAIEEISSMCPKLTYQQRMIGFGTCFGAGYLISFCSFTFFVDLLEGDPLPFVYIYTLGNILALSSSMFLVGPKRQFKNMFDSTRRWTSIIYLSCLFLTLVICFIPNMDEIVRLLILVLLLFIQFFASLWYSLSYIPYARKTVTNCFKDTFGCDV